MAYQYQYPPDYTSNDTIPPPTKSGMYLFIQHVRSGKVIAEYWMFTGGGTAGDPKSANLDVVAGDVLRYRPKPTPTTEFGPGDPVVKDLGEQRKADWAHPVEIL